MPDPLPVSELHQVLTLLERMLLEQGVAGRKLAAWLENASRQLEHACRDQQGAWFVELSDGRPVAVVGALICEDRAFLSLRPGRHGRIVDEYVLPEYRASSVGARLHAAALSWLEGRGVPVRQDAAPNAARLAASAGCLRL